MIIAVFIIALLIMLLFGWRKRRLDWPTVLVILLLAVMSFGLQHWPTRSTLSIVTDGAESSAVIASDVDLRGLEPVAQQQRLLQAESSNWRVYGDGIEADVLAGLNLPNIEWQASALHDIELQYHAHPTERSIWTLHWRQPMAADRIQLRNTADQLLAEALVTARGEQRQASLSYQFNAEGVYPLRLQIIRGDSMQAEYPVMVNVRPAPAFSANLRFSAPSFEWRAAKAWIEQADIPFQSRVQIGKKQFREDRSVSAATPDAQRLQVVDWRYWQSLPENVQQAQRQALLNGELMIVFAADIEDQDSARQALQQMLADETMEVSWQSGNDDFRYFQLPLGKGGVLWLAEPQWHRIWQRYPERYARFMAERIAELNRREALWMVNRFPLLTGRAQSLCFDNASLSQLDVVTDSQRLSLPLQDGSWPGRRCVSLTAEQVGWLSIITDQQQWSHAVFEAMPGALQRVEKQTTMSRLTLPHDANTQPMRPWRWWLAAAVVTLLMFSWWRANRVR